MQVAITSRHGNIRQDTHDYMSRKAEKLLTFFERVTSIQVTVDFENDRASVELLVDAEHKHNFVSHDSGNDVTAAFDSAMHKMEQQIRKYKEKIQDHRRDRPLNEMTSEEIPDSGESSS